MPSSQDEQNLAYERAVRAARAKPELRELVERSFLQEDPVEAYRAFLRSEDWARVHRLLRARGAPRAARVIDFGGGRGHLSAALAHSGYDVVLCEINPSEVCGTGAARRLREAIGADFEIEDRGIAALAERGAFDAAVCRAVLHHVEPLAETLARLRATLRRGGVFVASDEPTVRSPEDAAFVRQTHAFTQFGVAETAYRVSDYVDALRTAGFTDVRVHHPVHWSSYREILHPSLPLAIVAAGYARLRVRAILVRRPGDVRAFTAVAGADASPR